MSDSDSTQCRFVVLHHTGISSPHFDLMIEAQVGAKLLTWRLERWPETDTSSAERFADHRNDYLTYEGPVSNHRGRVTRVACGRCILRSLGDHIEMIIDGQSLVLRA